MLNSRFWVLFAAAAVLCAGCVGPFKDYNPITLMQGKGSPALTEGIKKFEEGDYAEAQKSLLSALDQGLSFKSHQVKAHKYLAFIYCITGKEKQCREEFKKVLDINPDFQLEPAEAGHPQWGPVFRSVKPKK
ncbi:MAG TPA: TssQ family T6SS-associated lipoprotein [Burkholderiales bacterium]|nr:TssQ family T6SS-associated lipoprotein [Burkholderiales bacterium]